MDVAGAVEVLGGIATTKELLAHVTRRELDRAVAAGEVVRLNRGRYAAAGQQLDRTAADRVDGVISHVSAAQHWEWKVRRPAALPTVTVPRSRRLTSDRRAGVEIHRADLPPTDVEDGVTTRVRTVVDCARTLPFDEALAVADSALRSRTVTRDQLRHAALRLPRTGRTRALRVVESASAQADNPFESVLRAIALDVPGLSVEPQVQVTRGVGAETIGRVDLGDRELRIAVEGESWEFHGTREAFAHDVRRYTAMARAGWLVARFLYDDVMNRPAYVAAVLTDLVALRSPR